MAGHPLNKTEYYSEAATKAKEVIDFSSSLGYLILMEKYL
jgi:hypothetical protein